MARGATRSEGHGANGARTARTTAMEGILRALSGAKAQTNAREGDGGDGFAANLRAQLPALMSVINPTNGARARRRFERATRATTRWRRARRSNARLTRNARDATNDAVAVG